MLSVISSLSWSHSNVFIKHFYDTCMFYLLGKNPPINLLDLNKNRYADLDFGHNFVLPNQCSHITGFEGQMFLQVQKGQQCNYCIAVNDKQKLFFCPKAWTKMIRDSHCWTPAIQIFSEWLWHRNVAFSTLAWFLTLCSQSQRQTVLI